MKRKKVHHFIVPSRHNNYKPYFLRVEAVFLLSAVVTCLWGGVTFFERELTTRGSVNVAAVVSSVLADLVNSDRASNGLFGLTVSDALTRAAQMKADDMALRSYFAHTAPDGTEPWHWFEKAGYSFTYAGENLAVFFSDSAEVERAWMNSPTHRANLLDPHFTEVGIAMANGLYQGRPTVFVVQEFGTPREQEFVTEAEPEPVVAKTVPVETTPIPKPLPPAPVVPKKVPVTPKVIAKTDTYISVEGVPVPTVAGTSSTESAPVASTLSRLITSPRTTLSWIYFLISFMVILTMMLIVFVETERRHWMGVVYGGGLLALMVVLTVAEHLYFGSQLLVI